MTKITKIDKYELKETFQRLLIGKNSTGKDITAQERGYLFEAFLTSLFKHENIETEGSFKICGEQIDGGIKFGGDYYIIEAKWEKEPVLPSDLYQFSMKVEGKMYGRGIFFSATNFSSNAVEALSSGKHIKIILVDGEDLKKILEGQYTLKEVLTNKIKAAQLRGKIYVDASGQKEK